MRTYAPSRSDPITDPEILDSIARLPTEDDLPCDDGEPMETARHRDQMHLLIDSLKQHWSRRRDFYAGGNMFLHFDPTDRRKVRGPDFFLVLGVPDRERKSWVVWQEGMRFPDVIVELLSDSTRDVDLHEKKDLYEQVFHTPEYYVYDPYSQEFHGYHLHLNRYQDLEPDARGRIPSPVTRLQLGLHEGWLRWFTRDGRLLPSPQESAAHAREQARRARHRAEQEKHRAEQEKHRAEQEKHRAEQEKHRAEQEKHRAEQEKHRADLAEERAARLAARLRALGIDPDDGGR